MRVHVVIGLALSVLLFLFGVLAYAQTRDPLLLAAPVELVLVVWGSVLIYHVLTEGVPVRIVRDERRPPS